MSIRRSGFTMVELLSVVGIVTLLSALLFPAVMQSREEARLQTCKNNLKQLGLSLYNYHDTYGTLGPGWVSKNWKADDGPSLGWQFGLLPYVDQGALFNKLDITDAENSEKKLFQTRVKIYHCPSDVLRQLNPMRGEYGISNYSGNAGNQRLPGSLDTPQEQNGVFYCNSSVELNKEDIPDGVSNTFMVGERGIASSGGIWMGVRQNRYENDAVTDCSVHSQLNASSGSFSSSHEGGANFLYCDGSVRLIDNDIESSDQEGELGTYQKLAQRYDSKP